MTLSIAWVRKIAGCEELVFVTDSRLRAGYAWDCCPKILTLPRSDCAICFAGSTFDAYPLMFQIKSTLESFPKSRSRAMDIVEFKTYSLKIFNSMRSYIHDLPVGQKKPEKADVVFILGGYSWINKRMVLWKLIFNHKNDQFQYVSIIKKDPNKIAVVGDYIGEFKKRLNLLRNNRGWKPKDGLDMEPFEVIRDMLLEAPQKNKLGNEKYPYIGGAPQMVKVYQHMNCRPFAVYWPDKKGKIKLTVSGRPLMDYETTDLWVFDPKILRSNHPFYSGNNKNLNTRVIEYVIENIINIAKDNGTSELTINTADIQNGMELIASTVPDICETLDSKKFLTQANVVLLDRNGNLRDTTATWKLKITS